MTRTKRYAEGTKVPARQSVDEAMGILTKYGAERRAYMTGPEGDQLGFVLRGRSYRMNVMKPTEDEAEGDRAFTYRGIDYVAREYDRRWRATILLLKAKIEFTQGDDDALARELMPYLLTTSGKTIGELVDEGRVEEAVGVPLIGA